MQNVYSSIIISGSRNVYKQQQGPLLVRNGGIRTTMTKTTRMFQLAPHLLFWQQNARRGDEVMLAEENEQERGG